MELKKEVEKVAAVKCTSYMQKDVDRAVKKALELIGFDFAKGKTILIKPNVVGAFPLKQTATTTNPSIVEAVCKILKKKRCRIFIGDSPFTEPEASFRASGIDNLKKYGRIVIFEQEKAVEIQDKKAKILKEFEVAEIVKTADLIINIPKLKTHSLMKYTGAIKNLYGVILGGMKQRLHNHARGEKKFAKVLADIYQNVRPELNIMDAVVGMEGEGPTSGDAKKVGMILASRDAVALDIACCKIIGLRPKRVLYIKEAVKRKLYPSYEFEEVGEKIYDLDFKIPVSHEREKSFRLIKKSFREKPIVCDVARCIRCGRCAKHCPGKAIILAPYPQINRKKCIRCFCCMEICPRDALSLKK